MPKGWHALQYVVQSPWLRTPVGNFAGSAHDTGTFAYKNSEP